MINYNNNRRECLLVLVYSKTIHLLMLCLILFF